MRVAVGLSKLWRHDAAVGSLASVRQELTALAGSTERDFLHLGERLQDIVTRAGEQRQHINRLLVTVAGSSANGAGSLLEEISRWARGSSVAGGAIRFEELAPVVRAIQQPLQSLNNAIRALRVMGVITRIESARLGSRAAGFEALASEVISLAESIDVKSTAVFAAVHEVCELLTHTQKTAVEIDCQQRARLQLMTAECAEAFCELAQEQDRAREVSLSTQERYEKFSSQVGDLVAALQCQDATKQRLEHIVDGLRDASDGLSAGRSASLHLLQLQALQLVQTRESFLEAVNNIDRDMERIAAIVGDCTRMAGKLLETRKESSQSFMGNLERRFSAIALAAGEIAESRREVVKVALEVQQSCARMSAFVGEIEAIGEIMLRLALNAEIQAVHLAGTGVVMEAVAAGIRTTSEKASEGARGAGQSLREVETAARDIRALAGGNLQAEASEAASLAERIILLTSDLKNADSASSQMLTLIAGVSDELSTRINNLRRGMRAGQTFESASNSCLASLRSLAAAVSPRDRKGPSAETLADAGRNYTMHAEREVHTAFTGVPASGLETGVAAASELGENVELF